MTSFSSNKLLAKQINNIIHNYELKSLLNSYGLEAHQVCWEDTARTKNSSMGPNISDMTLRAEETDMPVIRRPNFADITVDHPIDKFNVTIGNESGNELSRICFKEYLENINKYTGNNNISKLIDENDLVILCSTQACMLPASDAEVNFNVRMFNYQTRTNNPAVLVIISSNQGTSTQILDSKTTDILFNSKSKAYDFVAERLKEERKRLGKDLNSPMSDEEKERNVLFIYQIPLKVKEPERPKFVTKSPKASYISSLTSSSVLYDSYTNKEVNFSDNDYEEGFDDLPLSKCNYSLDYLVNYLPSSCKIVLNESECLSDSEEVISNCAMDTRTIEGLPKVKLGLDNAMLRVSTESKGDFIGTNGLALERDFRYPIRCTLQYYWITDSSELNENQIKQISEQLEKFYSHSSNKSSLVMSDTNRPTEPKIINDPIIPNPNLTIKPLNSAI